MRLRDRGRRGAHGASSRRTRCRLRRQEHQSMTAEHVLRHAAGRFGDGRRRGRGGAYISSSGGGLRMSFDVRQMQIRLAGAR